MIKSTTKKALRKLHTLKKGSLLFLTKEKSNQDKIFVIFFSSKFEEKCHESLGYQIESDKFCMNSTRISFIGVEPSNTQ